MGSVPLKKTVVPLREGDSKAMSTKLVVSPRAPLALAVLPLPSERFSLFRLQYKFPLQYKQYKAILRKLNVALVIP